MGWTKWMMVTLVYDKNDQYREWHISFEAIVDDLISAFMHIDNYRSWLKGGPTDKGPNHSSLNLKAAIKCSTLKLSADAMKEYFGTTNSNTWDCDFESSELYKPTKYYFDWPPGADCDSHRPDKVNYCGTSFLAIACLNGATAIFQRFSFGNRQLKLIRSRCSGRLPIRSGYDC